jgi:O-antigen ligase
VFLVFLAVARVSALEQGQRAILTGMILGLAVQGIYALVARAGGALQTGGSLGHQNLLGFVSHMALLPAFAMFLAHRWSKTALIGVASGLVVVILTASRATIAFSAVGLTLSLLLCLFLRFNSRKALIGALGSAMLLASVPLASAALERRFQAQGTTFFAEDKERLAFESAAWAMIGDHPLGVGPNHYVFIANTEGYSERAGVTWSQGSRSTNVHNSYLLVLAETGYLGLFAICLILGLGLWHAFSSAFRFRRFAGSEIFVGLGCALISVILHSYYEWMLVAFPSQYLLAATLGLISGIRAFYSSKQGTHQLVPSGARAAFMTQTRVPRPAA